MKCIRCKQNVSDVSNRGVCVVCLDIECDMMKRAVNSAHELEQRAERAERNLESAGKGFPAKCPFTGLDFFMEIEHPDYGLLPTYGGPFDSYTIPRRCDDSGDQQFERLRYDHDEGYWKEWEGVPLQVIDDEKLWTLEERAERAEKACAHMNGCRNRMANAFNQYGAASCVNSEEGLKQAAGEFWDADKEHESSNIPTTYLSPAEVREAVKPLTDAITEASELLNIASVKAAVQYARQQKWIESET